jgi:hypothetical protein
MSAKQRENDNGYLDEPYNDPATSGLSGHLGYCVYCHDIILFGDEIVVKKGKICHLFCFKQKNNFEEELDF